MRGRHHATGVLADLTGTIARQRLTVRAARNLREYHARMTAGAGTAPRTVLNSTAVIQGYTSAQGTVYPALGYSGLRQFGDIEPLADCVAAAQAIDSLLVSSCTGGQQVYLPEGGNPSNTDTIWSSAGAVPANAPGVVAWAQAWGVLYAAYLFNVLAWNSTIGKWPYGGMVDAAGNHHLGGSYGSLDWTNQAEVQLALQYFKCIQLVCNGSPILSAWGGNRCVYGQAAANGTNHCFVACDCGPASTLAALYGITLPGGMTGTTWCLGGLTWGAFVIVDWASWLNLGSYSACRITNNDRGDAPTFNAAALADLTNMSANPAAAAFLLGQVT